MGVEDKKQCFCSKMSFYYLTANKTGDVFQNSGPLASLRLQNSGWGALISVDLLKKHSSRYSFHIFITGLYLEGWYSGGLIYGTTFVLYFDGLI